MRIVIGVDWSDEAFAAVQQALFLYRPTEVTVVHGIEMGMFEYPAVAHLAGLQGHEEYRRAVTAAGEQLLDRTADTLTGTSASVKRINAIGNPARLILMRRKARMPISWWSGRAGEAGWVKWSWAVCRIAY